MAHSGSVHLYVEVRSVSDNGKKALDNINRTDPTMLQGLDRRPQSQHSLKPLPGDLNKGTRSTQNLFNIKPPFYPREQTPSLQSLPHTKIYQLHSGLQPGIRGGTLMQTHSSENKPFYANNAKWSGHFTAPPTPTGLRRSCGPGTEGKQSIVKCKYVEKANIKSLRGQHNIMCQNEQRNPFTRAWDDQVGWKSVGNANAKHTLTGSINQPRCSPNLQRAVVDSIARQATHRALEEFGSPQLRRHFALNTNRDCGSLHREPSNCHSWSGSPVLPRITRTLDAKAQLINPDQQKTVPGYPRNSASDHLSHAKQHYHTISHPTNVQSQGIPNQKVLSSGDRRQEFRQSSALPTCKPTDIQHEYTALPITQTPFNQQTSQRTSPRRCQTHEVNVSISCLSNQSASQGVSVRRSISPITNTKISCNAPQETTKLMEDREFPSPNSSSLNSGRSDSQNSGGYSRGTKVFHSISPQNYSPSLQDYWEQESVSTGHTDQKSAIISLKERTSPTFHARFDPVSPVSTFHIQPNEPKLSRMDSPVIHHHQPSQHTGRNCLPGLEDRHYYAVGYDSCLRDSPDSKRRLSTGLTTNTLESSINYCTRGHQFCREGQDANKENIRQDGDSLGTLTKNSSVPNINENNNRVPAQREFEVQGTANVEQIGALSQSSSGVTGSLWETTQPERDSISPDTFSQTSQKSTDTGNIAIQVKSKLSFQDPSSHYQKIARAKWEFLFGKPSEDQHGVNVSSYSGFSSESPNTATLPPKSTTSCSSRRPVSKSQKTFTHDVQQVDMELVNTPTSSKQDTSLKTGIVRRTVKYSETDLDAVPLRCYRETDIDEVLLAEQEEIDSAFSSDHSVLATSGTSMESPLDGQLCTHASEEKVDQLHDEDVVSWASVRMHCDRKRHQALQDGDEVFTRLLEGPQNRPLDSHAALKSPITVESPIRTSTDGLDSFSRHFESIIESHRAKGTSCSSLDSTDTASNGPPIFTFDLPTLTPEIQSQISKSAKQITEMNFASLTHPETPNLLSPGSSEVLTGEVLNKVSEESETTGSASTDNPILSESNVETRQGERVSQPVSHTEYEVAQRLALGSNEHNGCKADLQAVKLLAKRLYNLDGFRRSDIAKHLSKNNEFSRMVAEEYLSYFNFSGMIVDQALRVFLREFPLIGETQERERVLSHFSRRYLQCNPSTISSEDGVHTLTCALMLLNTDLHGHNVGKKMTCMQFISNLEGLNGGQNFPKDLLKALYNSIKNEKLHWTIDEEDVGQSLSELTDSRTDSASHTLKRVTSGGGPIVSLTQQSKAQVYKNGFLVRKVHADTDGKRTPRGKRGWKSFCAILKGLVLYLQKNEFGANKQLSDEDLKNAVSIHHSLAMKAADYSKRPNVFYLRTADWRVFLLQAPNAEQMQSWITRINTVAAMFSAPPFPAAIGSQRKFSRPLLPGSTTKLSQEEQIKSHEMRFRSISAELQELRSVPQDRKPKGKDQEEAKQREEYLEFEKTRYGTYAMLLRAKLRMGELDLVTFEAQLFADGALQRANSSPTLPHDTSQASASSCSSTSRSKKSSRSEGHRHKPAVKQ